MTSADPQTAQARDLLAALRLLLDSAGDAAGVKGIRDRWPDEYQAAPAADQTTLPGLDHLPVLDHLPGLAMPQDAAAARVLQLLMPAAAGFNWRQSYDENDFSRHFLNNYGWFMLAGDGGLIRADGLLITLLMLGPEATYPRHSHAAEELYQVIAGEVEIDTDDRGWRHYTPGMTCHHIPWVPHALRCGTSPVILMAIWKADRFIKSRIDPRPDKRLMD